MIDIYANAGKGTVLDDPFFFNAEAECLVESLVANFYCNFDLSFKEACENAKLALGDYVTPTSVPICKDALARLRRTKKFREDIEQLKKFHLLLLERSKNNE